MQEISFTVEGLKLVGTIFYPPSPKEKNPAILFVHGWMSSQESAKGRADALSKQGYICMTFSMRGHGESEGDIATVTRKEFLDDVLGAYDFLTTNDNVNPEKISAVGASFGAYLACMLSAKRKVSNIVLRVPANYPNESFEERQIDFSGNDDPRILHPKFKKINDSYAIDALRNFPGEVLVVESEKDEMIPRETVLSFVHAVSDKSKITHEVMKGADHSIKDEKLRADYTKILVDWFRKRL